MTGHEFVLVDVFTDEPFGGNQLAVFPDARGLDDRQMQQIARELNFAESTFVVPADDPRATARLRIFSPRAEMPFAGHPTVGSAAVLARRLGPPGDRTAGIVFDEQVGLVSVAVVAAAGRIHSELTLTSQLERPDERPDRIMLATAIGLDPDLVQDAWFAGVGVGFCFCRLVDAAAVDAATLDMKQWQAALGRAWAQQVYLFSGEMCDGAELYARMFAPALGIVEDAATGSGAAALVATLAAATARVGCGVQRMSLSVRQGVQMGRPSLIRAGAVVDDGTLHHVTVGGGVVFVGTGRIDL